MSGTLPRNCTRAYPYGGPRTEEAVRAHLRSQSGQNTSVLVAHGIFGDVTVYEFPTVSSIPDAFASLGNLAMYRDGEPADFTPGQKRREEARAYTADR